jgi:hypothetical protein
MNSDASGLCCCLKCRGIVFASADRLDVVELRMRAPIRRAHPELLANLFADWGHRQCW